MTKVTKVPAPPSELDRLVARWDLVLPVDPDLGSRARLASRPPDLAGRRLGLLDNSKGNAGPLLERIALRFGERYRLRDVLRLTKPIFSRVAPDDQLEQLRSCDVVVTAIAD